jgi:CRP/FNR family transcriptional regulator
MRARLEAVPLIQAIGAPARASVLAVARLVTTTRGGRLVEAGETLSDVFLLLEGTLRIFAQSVDGKEATLYRLRPGEVCLLSLNAAFTDGRYPANVEAESERAALVRIPGKVLRELFRAEPAVQDLVLQSLTATIGELLAQLDHALLASLSARLSAYLARQASLDGVVSATQQQIADGLGVTRETVSRELQRLRRAGRVATGRGRVRLIR